MFEKNFQALFHSSHCLRSGVILPCNRPKCTGQCGQKDGKKGCEKNHAKAVITTKKNDMILCPHLPLLKLFPQQYFSFFSRQKCLRKALKKCLKSCSSNVEKCLKRVVGKYDPDDDEKMCIKKLPDCVSEVCDQRKKEKPRKCMKYFNKCAQGEGSGLEL